MDNNQKNAALAFLLSLLIIFTWQAFFVAPPPPPNTQTTPPNPTGNSPQENIPQINSQNQATQSTSKSITAGQKAGRVKFRNERIAGSINLRAARIDELHLLDYRTSIDKQSPTIQLLNSQPSLTQNSTFIEFGFSPNKTFGNLPGPNTIWQQLGTNGNNQLTPNSPIMLFFENELSIKFIRKISLDENYLFTIEDKIENNSQQQIELQPYGRIARQGEPQIQGIFILHEGLIDAVGDEGLEYIQYDDLEDTKIIERPLATKGWLGITDKYWASLLIPNHSFTAAHRYRQSNNQRIYQSEYIGSPITIAGGNFATITTRTFAGAKETEIIDAYQQKYNLELFDKVIDWGWLYWLTKPLFFLIKWIFGYVGNFGVAILLVTVLIKLAFFPLANKSYISMANMKRMQPQMLEIRKKYGEDRQAQSKAMMELYKKEKINPAAGCWPILIQIPVFFALYTVLYITIEMRHAPFFGWVNDLSAPDPTSIFNLFGLLPFGVPDFLLVGVWPLIMGITMFVQMQMNPAPPDPMQQAIFKWLPVVFTFLLATFPAGLVIYWAWNNFLSIIQQGTIMKRQGAKIELWDNLKAMFLRKK